MKKTLLRIISILFFIVLLIFVWSEITYGENEYYNGIELSMILKLALTVAVLGLAIYYESHFDFFLEFPQEIYQSRRLFLQLARNDFKNRYAGSIFGIIWAFVQPIVTVFIYWFVFQVCFKTPQTTEVPYMLWLLGGIVPWFFFSDAVVMGTNALLEYQYLVKKVVFRIDILPLIKICSAIFVHLFFIVFTIVLYACYKAYPTLYTLQLLYYTFCIVVISIGIAYASSAVAVFFRDISQLISIALQLGVWFTPIMWNFDTAGFGGPLRIILQLNPLFYIVQGYRDSLISHVWFWERPTLTVYFWVVSIFILGVGASIFKKLKIHFADVL